MTKAEIIEQIVSTTGMSRKECSAVVEAFMDVVKKSLIEKKRTYSCVVSVAS